jgi:hypothetical protein
MPKPSKKLVPTRRSKKTKSKPVPGVVTKTSRPNTKSHVITQLLGRETGATVKELAAATSWQEHSVRGFMSGTLKKKLGLDVSSEIVNGVRHYKINGTGAGK